MAQVVIIAQQIVRQTMAVKHFIIHVVMDAFCLEAIPIVRA
jgi:hypothetical protein